MLARLRAFGDRYRDAAPLLLRVLVGARLAWGAYDNVISGGRMGEFADYLAGFGFPLPMLSATVSAWAQFVCGLLFIVGAFTRPAAAVMVFNFLVAVLAVHLGRDSFEDMFPPLAILATSVFLFLNGPGTLSVDAVRERRRRA
ncbi:MAG TPA: DoxX family protein [Rhodothermales bacterium]|nr:DoxX family protein [Rhodothermales bacterium]